MQMPVPQHSLLFTPGAWAATGLFWEGGRTARPGRGRTVVRHGEAAWEIEGEMEISGDVPLRFTNLYRIELPPAPGEVLRWRSSNPAVGELHGVFAVAGEAILSFFRTADGGHEGSETLTRLAPDRYRATGIFLSAGVVVSTWSMELVRQD